MGILGRLVMQRRRIVRRVIPTTKRTPIGIGGAGALVESAVATRCVEDAHYAELHSQSRLVPSPHLGGWTVVFDPAAGYQPEHDERDCWIP